MKDIFVSSYKNKKNEEKFSIGVTKDFLQSMYSLEKNAYEQLFEQISQYLEIDDIEVSEEKIEEFKDFLMLYFSF
tara:strand:- start:654 stop:878 length:225 start_codon:yes stop_codon:yes gene_type:complete